MKIDISGLDRAELLAALVNGTGLTQNPMTKKEAQAEIDAVIALGEKPITLYFDYVRGRHLKVDIGSDFLDSQNYDLGTEEGRAAEVVAALRAKG